MKNLALGLAVSSLALSLVPSSPAMARAPVYKAMESELAPTLSVSLVDDSDPKMAILDLGLSNPTDNFLTLKTVYFSSKAEVDTASKDAYYDASYINFWDTYYYPKYTNTIYLAPQSSHLHRRLAIRKPAAALSMGDHEPNTYKAIKSGEALVSAFSGVVSKAVTLKNGVDYSQVTGELYATNYSADTNQTRLTFYANYNGSSPRTLDANEQFFQFTFAGVTYQNKDAYTDEDDRPWVNGLHYQEEFTNISVAYYKKGETLQDTSVNLTESSSQDGVLNALPYIVIGGLALLALGLIAGLIVLGVWLRKKRRRGTNPS
jgi:hypothetical protein